MGKDLIEFKRSTENFFRPLIVLLIALFEEIQKKLIFCTIGSGNIMIHWNLTDESLASYWVGLLPGKL